MKNLIICTIILISFYSCSKSASPNKSVTGTSSSVTYKNYEIIDSSYNVYITLPGPMYYDVTVETQTGDTTYDYAGTPSQVIHPNLIVNYNADSVLNNSLIFTSSTTGIEASKYYNNNNFKYSFATGYFDDRGSSIDTNNFFKISQINSSTIKLYIVEKYDGLIDDSFTYLYKKEN